MSLVPFVILHVNLYFHILNTFLSERLVFCFLLITAEEPFLVSNLCVLMGTRQQA